MASSRRRNECTIERSLGMLRTRVRMPALALAAAGPSDTMATLRVSILWGQAPSTAGAPVMGRWFGM